MNIDVHLLEVATGERAVYQTETYDAADVQSGEIDHGVRWMWDEGNYGCDCNRELFFCWAIGRDEPDDLECGDGERFVVDRIVERGTERVIFTDATGLDAP